MKGVVLSILFLLAIAVLLFIKKPTAKNIDLPAFESRSVKADIQQLIPDQESVTSRLISEPDSIQHSELAPEESTFNIPEGIDENCFVVAFYDPLCKCPTAIVYDDARKRKASRITFYADGTTDRKGLVPLSSSSFGERFDDWPEDKPHYDVHPGIVQYVHTSGSIGETYRVLRIN